MNRDHNRPSTSAKAPADSPRHEPVHEPLLDAMHLLEAALSSPAPGREETWRERVAAELATLRNVLATHVASTESRKGMFVDVESTEPALHHRIERLRYEHADLLRQAESLEMHLAPSTPGHPFNFHDVRQRAGWLLTALRHHQALEADLIFELYDSDVGVGD